MLLSVPQDQGELCIQGLEHLHAVFVIQGQKNLAIRLALQVIFLQQPLPQGTEAVQLAVAHHRILVEVEGLHAPLVEAHDRQAMKAQVSAGDLLEPAHVRTSRDGAVKARFQFLYGNRFGREAANGTHKKHLRSLVGNRSDISGRMPPLRGAT